MMSGPTSRIRIRRWAQSIEENMNNFVVSTLFAGRLAPLVLGYLQARCWSNLGIVYVVYSSTPFTICHDSPWVSPSLDNASFKWLFRDREFLALRWRHNGHDGVSNHQPHHCLLNRLFGCRSKKNQSSASLAFVRGIHRGPVNSPHKWPVSAENVSIWWRHHGLVLKLLS